MELIAGIYLIFLAIALLSTVFWIWSLVDAIQNAKDKLLWVLIIVFLNGLGSILWFLMGERESKAVRYSRRTPRNSRSHSRYRRR